MADDRELFAVILGEVNAGTNGRIETDLGLPNDFDFMISCPLCDVGVIANDICFELSCSFDHAVGAIFCQDESFGWCQQIRQAFFGLMKSLDRNDHGNA